MTSPPDTPETDDAQEAERWRQARPVLEALVERNPRCIPVLVELARNLINADQ
ncbi:hypothetical protein AB0E08_08130 [Streptomyces sp. NPDC048281]|uniref:hypothetical protein n=1 Tax=Streptomyces sp. NPDC048281 TaxID=3154715 RepID=UPI00341934AF